MRKLLSKAEIKKLLEKPASADLIKLAAEHQLELQQHHSNTDPEIIFKVVKELLTSQKFSKFKEVFSNHSQTLINKVERHYNRVFTAHGKVTVIDFMKNDNLRTVFETQKQTLFGRNSDDQYFRENGTRNAIVEPNSIYIVGNHTNEQGLVQAMSKHVKIKEIHDIDADESGIRYVIIKYGDKKNERFFVYDDVNYSVWFNSSAGFILDPEYNEDLVPHFNRVCPAVFVYDENLTSTNFVQKKSVISDSIKDLQEYCILRTFYTHYKHFSAFGRDIKPQTRCNYKSTEHNVMCNGSGGLVRIDSSITARDSGVCPSCAGKNKAVWGEVMEIPLTQQSNEVLINNYSRLNFRIEADTNILTFHAEDVKSFKSEILNDIIGEGYGQAYRTQAVNTEQVQSNFDDQESNLNHFKTRIEKSWEFILKRAAEVISPDAEYVIKKKLGDKYFLKTVEQLYAELKSLYEGTSNTAIIEQKQFEILLTENRNDSSTIQRYQMVRALKPFSMFPLEYITSNRPSMSTMLVNMFDNFDQILGIFESQHGRIENMVMDETNAAVVIKNLNVIFKSILLTISPEKDVNKEQQTQPVV